MKKNLIYFLGFVVIAGAAAFLWILFPSKEIRSKKAADTPQIPEKIINEPVQPIPLSLSLDEKRVALGRKLFHETQISKNGTVSCATCHDLALGGTDRRRVSSGMDGAEGEINSPSVFNSGFNFKQFWDGRAENLEDQIDGPVHNSKEMDASDWPDVIARLKANPDYAASFSSLYPEGIGEKSIKDAIATFERSLYTPNARFDKYLQGNASVITEQEKEGYRLFKDLGCVVCHQGVNVGGNMFQTFGKFGDYFSDRGHITKADFGRMNVTGQERDRYKFKVPTLRNVQWTAPYFHDGSAKTLEEAVRVMAKYQLGLEMSDDEVSAITAFLKTLNGEYEGKPLGKE